MACHIISHKDLCVPLPWLYADFQQGCRQGLNPCHGCLLTSLTNLGFGGPIHTFNFATCWGPYKVPRKSQNPASFPNYHVVFYLMTFPKEPQTLELHN